LLCYRVDQYGSLVSIKLVLIITTLNKFIATIPPFTVLGSVYDVALHTTRLETKIIRLCPQSKAEVKIASQRKTTISTSVKRNNSNLASETLRGASFNFTEFYKAHKYIEPNWLE
jgi:hypothetical protein